MEPRPPAVTRMRIVPVYMEPDLIDAIDALWRGKFASRAEFVRYTLWREVNEMESLRKLEAEEVAK